MRFKFLLSGQVHVMAPKIVQQKKLILMFFFSLRFLRVFFFFAKFVNALLAKGIVVGVC